MSRNEINRKINKAVIPVAGWGTRLLPITKSVGKEMMPVYTKPAVQYIVEEVAESGVEEIIFVVRKNQEEIRDYFTGSKKLLKFLKKNQKQQYLDMLNKISKLCKFKFVTQKKACGLANAVMQAKKAVDGEPFALLLGDDLVYNKIPCIKQLINVYMTTGKSVIASLKVSDEHISKYGNIGGRVNGEKIWNVNKIIEKPAVENKLSNDAVVGRYVFDNDIFEIMKKTGYGNESSFTEVLKFLAENDRLCAYEFDGIRYDTGDKIGLLKANIEYALHDEREKEELSAYLKNLIK
jgi:UTP--glucose-1-phosphate uridylyltransferase